MLRISKLTDYATVILAALCEREGAMQSAAEVAERTRIGLPTVSKIMKELHRAGLVASVRGARGGYQLARPAEGISAADIIDAVEGPFALTECSSHLTTCDLEATCRVGHAWQRVNHAIRLSLVDVKLTQLMHKDPPFQSPDLTAKLRAGSTWRPLKRA
ncbi:MAG: SUF system Fe-S cluster assembly regulator [Steroidobacteraceae bacterium]|nr:SUF system Fe-S cluster assembly regulator [Steroidobacteraceae bacterium]MCC7199270.1 SUF system Fe-S cluster assembly regulator [Gammaproteobacteria bacterium]